MNDATVPLDETDALRADIYRLLARLLLAPPDRDLLDFLAALEVEEDDSGLAAHWRALARSADDTDPEAARRAHFRHLVGVTQGEVTPYASWYRHGTLMDEPLVAIRRDLRRLGIVRAEQSRDPEDHLAALCEVMGLLVEQGSTEQADFFHAHLAPWAERCLADLATVDTPLYAATGGLGRAFLQHEAGHLPETGSRTSPIRIIDPAPG